MTEKSNTFRPPAVDRILQEPALKPWREKVHNFVITRVVRTVLEEQRAKYKNLTGQQDKEEMSVSQLAQLATCELASLKGCHLVPVINGTGIIINTNLGRSPLPASALKPVLAVLQSYCQLELNLSTGKRGDRLTNIEKLLQVVTGAPGALIVNNNAAAVLLTIAALSHSKEVIVSRGELVEIGGSFRLPDVIASAGGILREVGTTNRTRIEDYRQAISSNSGLIFKCHQSNFQIKGFVEEAEIDELTALSKESNIPLIEDLGSGSFIDLTQFGFASERTVQEAVGSGVQLVMFSADKLLGGPQAGIILGEKHHIKRLSNHPLYRVLRADKVLIAILEAVISEYLLPAPEKVLPILKMAAETCQSIEARVQNFINSATSLLSNLHLEKIATESAFGGGSSPEQTQPSFALAVKLKKGEHKTANDLTTLLRRASPPVIARVQNETVLIDFRTVPPEDEAALLAALRSINCT